MSTQREASRERIAQVHPADRFAAMFGEQVKPAPDFGEPWQVIPMAGFLRSIAMDRNGWGVSSDSAKQRAVQCVNDCAGMADPAAEIAEMQRERDEIRANYAEMCARLQECVQKHQIGLGGEKLDKLVCDEIATMREAIKEAALHLRYIANDADAGWDARAEARQALAKLKKAGGGR